MDPLQNSSNGDLGLHALPVSGARNPADESESMPGHYGDLPACKHSELMKLGSLQDASIQSLFGVMYKSLDGCVKRRNDDVPRGVASMLLIVMQEMEQRFSELAKSSRKQSAMYRSREERHRSKFKALEILATGTAEENEIVRKELQQMKIEKTKLEKVKRRQEQDLTKLRQEKEHFENQVMFTEEELNSAKTAFEENFLQMKIEAKDIQERQLKKIQDLGGLLADSRNKLNNLENFSDSKVIEWKRKEQKYKQFIAYHSGALERLRLTSESVKQEMSDIKTMHAEEFYHFGIKLRGLVDAAHNYHSLLEENRKLYNEVQDLKGNIRVYCRIRPFLPGQSEKLTTIEYIGENGELIVTNPSKLGKSSQRVFKFNKVFRPASTQEEVFQDTQPLIRSVLDGYNVCIFAYGQTGSGKTYTMTGPGGGKSTGDWGVNYRALNDLFEILRTRYNSISYDIGVQMVEIYNEQVRDLLSSDILPKRLGIWNTSLPNGLAVPDAGLHQVNSITDVLELMNIGLTNRVVGATALNDRSSRSHSILTVHVRGMDLETNVVLRGCLHLVDLAGSERVLRSEATGDRLREAQHINKSLSALGDVIFALAQKNPHVPYRNSKLTQVLQSSLGGQAKTLMFVQLNPDVESYSETISTLKFAERVSGVELGAAQLNKEGRGIRELLEQLTSLKEVVAKKDEEIRQLQLLIPNGSSSNRVEESTGESHQSYEDKNRCDVDEKASDEPNGGVESTSQKVNADAKFFSRQTTSAVGVVGRQSLGFARAVPPPGSRKSTFGSSSSSSAVKPPRR